MEKYYLPKSSIFIILCGVQYDVNVFEPFKIRNVVKQGCVLVTTLFAILTLLFLKQAFSTAEEGIYLHTQTDGKLFNPSRLKTKVKNNKIRDILFTYFGFIISLKKCPITNNHIA